MRTAEIVFGGAPRRPSAFVTLISTDPRSDLEWGL